jgi:hypothetical protein
VIGPHQSSHHSPIWEVFNPYDSTTNETAGPSTIRGCPANEARLLTCIPAEVTVSQEAREAVYVATTTCSRSKPLRQRQCDKCWLPRMHVERATLER